MAKKPDHLADFEADDTAGMLGKLLAEEDAVDGRTLWRIASWGAGATAAVVVAVMANQSSLGFKREQVAAADVARQTQQIQLFARETHSEARRLAAAIDTLNSDRDRLYSRVTGLEQGLDSVTGAIAKQGPTAASTPAANPPPSPGVGPVATAAAADKPVNGATTEPPAKEAAKTEPAKETVKEAAKAEMVKPEAARAETAKTDTARAELAKADTGQARNPPSPRPQNLRPPRRWWQRSR